MDAFESVVATILEHNGYWVRSRFKVNLTKEEKVEIGLPSLPRPELDLVAFRGKGNVLRIVECMSYLDSKGVSITAFNGTDIVSAKRYKLLLQDDRRGIVQRRLVQQLRAAGLVEERFNHNGV